MLDTLFGKRRDEIVLISLKERLIKIKGKKKDERF